MSKETPQPQSPDEQFMAMARQRLHQINQLEMTAEEKELMMHLIDEAREFETAKNKVKALKVYRELLEFLESIKANLKIPLAERWKERWDWEVGKRLIIDWHELKEMHGQENIESPEFSLDGENYLFKVKGPAGEILVKDEKTLWNRNFPHINYDSRRISPDGQSILVGFQTVQGKAGLAVNSEIWPQNYDEMEAFFSPNAKSVIAKGENKAIDHMEKDEDGNESPVYKTVKDVIIKDQEIILESDTDYYQRPTLSPDNQQFACGVIDADDFGIIVNGKKWDHHFFECNYPVFSPDSKKVAIVYLDDAKGYSVAENDKLIWVDYYEDCKCGPVYSPDSKRIAIAAMIKKGDEAYTLVENGRRIWENEFTDIERILYSPDGNNIAAVVQDQVWSWTIFINDREAVGKNVQIDTVAWSPDGKKIMYICFENGKYYRVVENVERLINE